MQFFETNLRSLARRPTLRVDPKYRRFWDAQGGRIGLTWTGPLVRLGDSLVDYRPGKVDKGALDEPRILIELGDVERKTSRLLAEREVSEIGSDKVEFGEADLVVCRLEPYLGKILLNDPEKRYIGSTEWIPLKFQQDVLLPEFWRYVCLADTALEALGCLKSGKRHARLSFADLREVAFPLPSLSQQKGIVAVLRPMEERILELGRSLKSDSEIVDAAFLAILDFDLDELERALRRRYCSVRLSTLGRAPQLRAGVTFNHPGYSLLGAFLDEHKAVPLRRFLSRNITLGATLKPATDLADDGPALYASAEALRNERVEYGELSVVSAAYWEKHRATASLEKGDILIARSGECVGKRARLETNDQALVYSDFTMRVQLRPESDPDYVWYFIRSALFQHQMDREIIHAKSVKNLFPSQVSGLRIVFPDARTRRKIEDCIRGGLTDAAKGRAEIARVRKELDAELLRRLSQAGSRASPPAPRE